MRSSRRTTSREREQVPLLLESDCPPLEDVPTTATWRGAKALLGLVMRAAKRLANACDLTTALSISLEVLRDADVRAVQEAGASLAKLVAGEANLRVDLRTVERVLGCEAGRRLWVVVCSEEPMPESDLVALAAEVILALGGSDADES